jgi:hypothetical protein
MFYGCTSTLDKLAPRAASVAPANTVHVVDGRVIVTRNSTMELTDLEEMDSSFGAIGLAESEDEFDSNTVAQPIDDLRTIAKSESTMPVFRSVRKSTLEWKLKIQSPREVMCDLLAAAKIRRDWVGRGPTYSVTRVKERLRSGVFQLQGHDRRGRPILWMFSCLEDRSRDFASSIQQVEHASCILWSLDVALRMRPAKSGIEGVAFYYDGLNGKLLNFGLKFGQVLGKELKASMIGCMDSFVIFSPSRGTKASLSVMNEITNLDATIVKDRESVIDWVADVEADVPRHFFDSNYTGPALSIDALLDGVDRFCGVGAPYTMADALKFEKVDQTSETPRTKSV